MLLDARIRANTLFDQFSQTLDTLDRELFEGFLDGRKVSRKMPAEYHMRLTTLIKRRAAVVERFRDYLEGCGNTSADDVFGVD